MFPNRQASFTRFKPPRPVSSLSGSQVSDTQARAASLPSDLRYQDSLNTMSDTTPSAPLSNADAQALYHFGLDITQDAIGVIWETIFLSESSRSLLESFYSLLSYDSCFSQGAYGIFFAVAVYTIFRKGLKSRSSVVMLFVVIYLSTGQANINLAPLGTPMEALFMFNMVIGDSVIIWRAWVLHQRTIWVVSIPCLMLLMSFIFSVIDIICLTDAGWADSGESAIAGGGGICGHAELTAWAFSLLTNIICTTQHRKSMKSLNILGNPRRMSTDKILSILVESGFVYCLFLLTQLILFFDVPRDTPLIYVYLMFAGMGDQISGMYPTLIIVIVNLHHTIWEEESASSRTRPRGTLNTSTIQFASASKRSGSGPTETTLTQRSVNVHLDTDPKNEVGSILGINMRKIPIDDPELPCEFEDV
ncbi:hypothetical protein B0H11DRAFT_2199204 [Mycena galericulata]|nr:hypothetical protein B0H11DRAFT_2202798 [Mycena galericulata]KAJ7459443.1 hypothetical protein B0H11DRAFT_2199204 [Mycena galericulata]